MLQRLLAARGVSGNEGEVRKIILEAARPLADEITVDALGNVIATVRGTDPAAPRVMLAAHMDEVGLIVTNIKESPLRGNGHISYEPVGAIDPVVMVSKRVLVGKKAVPGVVGAKAIHLQERGEREKPFRHKDLSIDIGSKDKADALSMVSVGDYVTFDSPYVEFGDGLVKSRALDDRIGCAALLKLMENKYPCTVHYTFTVQEEIGCRGAKAAAYRLEPDIALILEGTSANDIGDAKSHEEVCELGKGPTISFMDRASVAHYPLMLTMREVAEKNGIPWQIKRYVSGGNDSGVIQRTGGGVKTCVLSVPCRYIHSPSSVCSLKDIENITALTRAFLQTGAKIGGN